MVVMMADNLAELTAEWKVISMAGMTVALTALKMVDTMVLMKVEELVA